MVTDQIAHHSLRLLYFSAATDPEDLWDFGTVRHAGTVGRAQQNPVQVSGPPLTWENNGTHRTGSSSSSSISGYSRKDTASMASSITAKGELPPLPPSAPATPQKFDKQATIRHGTSGLSREPSDEYDDDYEDQVVDPRAHQVTGDDDLPDTTMLDSVVLPAIASVCLTMFRLIMELTCSCLSLVTAFPSCFYPGSPCRTQRSPAGLH